MMIARVSLDLAKNVFHVPGVDEHGKVVLRKHLRPRQSAWVPQTSCPVRDWEGGLRRCPSLGTPHQATK